MRKILCKLGLHWFKTIKYLGRTPIMGDYRLLQQCKCGKKRELWMW